MTKQYLELLEDVLSKGVESKDRTGTGTIKVFGRQKRWDLSEGFPLLTTKKLYTRAITHELLWFLKGDTNIKALNENKVTIWDEWADENGDLGPVYGKQWRSWPDYRDGTTIDQLAISINKLKEKPWDRGNIVSAWNVSDLDKMALRPCHALFQFNVMPAQGQKGATLDCQLYQRSCDLFLGVPFNIASYALLTQMVAQVTGLEPGEFIHTYGDLHLYLNHLEQAREQLSRTPGPLPKLELNPDVKNIDDFTYEDIKIVGYEARPHISAPISV